MFLRSRVKRRPSLFKQTVMVDDLNVRELLREAYYEVETSRW